MWRGREGEREREAAVHTSKAIRLLIIEVIGSNEVGLDVQRDKPSFTLITRMSLLYS